MFSSSRDPGAAAGGLSPQLAVAAVALVLGSAIAFDASAALVVASAAALGAVTLLLGRRAFWVLPLVALGIAGVPHGAEADALLSMRVGSLSLQSSDVFLAVGLLATVCAAGSARSKATKQESRWMLALGVFLLIEVCAAVWGLVSGNPGRYVLQDIRPLAGYALGIGGVALGRHPKGIRLLAGAIMLSATLASVLTVAVSSGLVPGGALLTAAGRLGIRNGVLWVIAIPLALEYALSIGERTTMRLVASVLLLVNLVALVWSGARAMWLAVALVLLYQLAALGRTGGRRRQIRVLAVVGALLTAVAMVGLPLALGTGLVPKAVAERVASLSSLQTDSSLGTRLATYSATNDVIRESPLMGGGLGTRVALFGRGSVMYEATGQYVDNFPQTVLLKSGIIGLAAFAFLFFVAALGVRRAASESGSPLMVSAEASMPGLLVLMASSAFLVVYVEVAVFALVWGVAVGMLDTAPG